VEVRGPALARLDVGVGVEVRGVVLLAGLLVAVGLWQVGVDVAAPVARRRRVGGGAPGERSVDLGVAVAVGGGSAVDALGRKVA
jgi:hypothetical protein